MKSYLDLLSHILENGEKREDRTNVGTISSFGHQLKFDLRDGFPAVTTKKLAWKGVVSELIWFLEHDNIYTQGTSAAKNDLIKLNNVKII